MSTYQLPRYSIQYLSRGQWVTYTTTLTKAEANVTRRQLRHMVSATRIIDMKGK